MLKKLYPDRYCQSLFQINWQQLHQHGIKALIFDLDNTITLWNSNHIDSSTRELIARLKELGFRMCILSNNSPARVETVAETLNIFYVARARKPSRKAYRQCLALMQCEGAETAVIGDQIFTDVLGGNRAGLYTILVAPRDKREYLGTRLSRRAEFFILPFIKRRLK